MAEEKKPETSKTAEPNYSNALLCWIFAPITSFIFMNDKDEFTKKIAKKTMYFGLIDIGINAVMFIAGTLLAVFMVGVCCFVIEGIWGLASLAVRIMGAIKANKGEDFEIPVINKWISN